MRWIHCAVVAILPFVATCVPARGEDPKATTILEKAISALGGEEKLGKHHQIGAKFRRLFPRRPGFFEIGGNIPNDAIDLRQSENEAVGGSGKWGHDRGLNEGGYSRNHGRYPFSPCGRRWRHRAPRRDARLCETGFGAG